MYVHEVPRRGAIVQSAPGVITTGVYSMNTAHPNKIAALTYFQLFELKIINAT